MYNVFRHERKLELEHSIKKSRAKQQKFLNKNKVLNESLAKKYNERKASNKSSPTNKQADLPNIRRPASPKSVPSSTPIRFKSYVRESDRINDCMMRNSWLDTTPSCKPVFKLRLRNKEKELQPAMRFRPFGSLENTRSSFRRSSRVTSERFKLG
jgi:hypothetical protein